MARRVMHSSGSYSCLSRKNRLIGFSGVKRRIVKKYSTASAIKSFALKDAAGEFI